ncbi:hypothetical protein G3N57_19045 [Paraburkholderia sp. Se-20369]|nr:hypothetical protein [Paraburkholderia sp. Se-20369]
MDSFLFTLKLLGFGIAGCLGVFGTLHDYRDKTTGRLTRWGKFAIFGLIVSSGIAVIAQIVEETLKDRSTKEAALQAAASAARSEAVVQDLARVLQPLHIERIHIHALSIPLVDGRFKQLREKVDANAASYRRRYEEARISFRKNGTSSISAACDKRTNRCSPLDVEIDASSPIFPRSGLESAVFRVSSVLIAFYKTPIDPSRFEKLIFGGPDEPDLSFNFGDITGREPLSLSKEVATGSYKLTGAFSSSFLNRDSTGRILSVPDLAGSQLFIRLPENAVPDSMVGQAIGGISLPKVAQIKRSDVLQYQRQFELGTVSLQLGSRTMWIPKAAWHKHATATAVYWEYIIPGNPFEAGPESPN